MKGMARSFVRQDEGQDLIEYALLCALLGVACITGILNLTRIIEFFAAVGVQLDNAI
jgi:Flp pilus assembly pilin Flp